MIFKLRTSSCKYLSLDEISKVILHKNVAHNYTDINIGYGSLFLAHHDDRYATIIFQDKKGSTEGLRFLVWKKLNEEINNSYFLETNMSPNSVAHSIGSSISHIVVVGTNSNEIIQAIVNYCLNKDIVQI